MSATSLHIRSMFHLPLRLVALLIALPLVVVAGAAPAVPARAAGDRQLLEPASGTYFGANIDWGADTVAAYNGRLGQRAAVYVRFFEFPFTGAGRVQLEDFIGQVARANGMAMLTLEPLAGLGAVTPAAAEELATQLAAYNAAGVPVFVRFAHEMNGSWYPWSQQPAAYRAAFGLLADAIHARAPQSALVWAPNYGGGYPFHGGQYEAQPGTAAFDELDSNHDGQLSMADDMYGPYYPGDAAVDWVGMSLYHWGSAYPWGENEIPEADKFAAQLEGRYNGLNGDDRAVPDFYAAFVEGHGKPLAIAETAALYNTEVGGADSLTIKRTWWRQVFDSATLARLPGIKMINWFEQAKHESEIGGALIDWSVTGDPQLRAAFVADLPGDMLLFADELHVVHRIYLPAVAQSTP